MTPTVPIPATGDAPGRGPLAHSRAWRARQGAKLEHTHGWEVELACSHCGLVAVPDFAGWTPSTAVRFGPRPTIYANLSCPRCRRDLRDAAGKELVGLFAEVGPPPGNRHPDLLAFALFGLPGLIGVALLGIRSRDRWIWARPFLQGPLLFLGSAIISLNGRIHAIRHRCACGAPAYKFMGLLGRSGGFGCSTCGRLLRLRDRLTGPRSGRPAVGGGGPTRAYMGGWPLRLDCLA